MFNASMQIMDTIVEDDIFETWEVQRWLRRTGVNELNGDTFYDDGKEGPGND